MRKWLARAILPMALVSSLVAAQGHVDRGGPLAIFATTGGYYLRAASPDKATIDVTCQSVSRTGWTYTLTAFPSPNKTHVENATPTLLLSNRWAYRLEPAGDGSFTWTAPDQASFQRLLTEIQDMGWSDAFSIRGLDINFLTHGTDDPNTITAFEHLCRLPGRADVY